METQILEGTLSEIQEQLRHLPCEPDKRIRVIVEDSEAKTQPKCARNGITLVPVKDPNRILTTEFVKELSHFTQSPARSATG